MSSYELNVMKKSAVGWAAGDPTKQNAPKAAISAARANLIVVTSTPSNELLAVRNGADCFELALQLQRLALRSSPDDDQRDAGRADEQHETFRKKLAASEPRTGRQRCGDRHLADGQRDEIPLRQRHRQIALAFQQRALVDQAGQINGGVREASGAAPIHLPRHPYGDEQAGDAGEPQIG